MTRFSYEMTGCGGAGWRLGKGGLSFCAVGVSDAGTEHNIDWLQLRVKLNLVTLKGNSLEKFKCRILTFFFLTLEYWDLQWQKKE